LYFEGGGACGEDLEKWSVWLLTIFRVTGVSGDPWLCDLWLSQDHPAPFFPACLRVDEGQFTGSFERRMWCAERARNSDNRSGHELGRGSTFVWPPSICATGSRESFLLRSGVHLEGKPAEILHSISYYSSARHMSCLHTFNPGTLESIELKSHGKHTGKKWRRPGLSGKSWDFEESRREAMENMSPPEVRPFPWVVFIWPDLGTALWNSTK
jgi:hypothetical protein